MNAEIIFSSETSSITRFRATEGQTSKQCFVTFSVFGSRSLRSKVGGTDPLLREGYDVFCVQTDSDDWHQSIFPSGIELLGSILEKDYEAAFGYGSSMGGHGAILYAKILKLKSVLALSPQYTISESFDQRWYESDQKIKYVYTMDDALDYDGDIVIYYDPFDTDAEHVELFLNNFKSSKIVNNPVKFGSHPVVHYFHDAGKLKELLLAFPKGQYTFNQTIDLKNNKTYLSQLSNHLLDNNKFTSAKTTILKALELGDETHSSYRRASDVFKKLDDFEEAIKYAKKAIAARNNNNDSHMRHTEHLADLTQLNGDNDGAKAIVEKLISESPNRTSAYLCKANLCMKMEKFDEAKAAALKAIELGDERHSTFRYASNALHNMKRYEEAIPFAVKAIAANDNSEDSRLNHTEHLANLKQLNGDNNGAKAIVDELINESPTRTSAYLSKANLCMRMDQFAEAKSAALKAIELGDERHSTFRHVSNALNRMTRYEEAIPFAVKAIAANDNTDDSRMSHTEHLANLKQLNGDIVGASAIVDKLISESPTRTSAYLSKANLCMRMDQFEEAQSAALKAIELGDERHTTFRHVSNALNRMKRYGEAIPFAVKAAAANDNSDVSRASHMEHLADLKQLNGDNDGAKAIVDELIIESPNRTSAHLSKANLCMKLGLFEEAKSAALKAIELGDERNTTFRYASNAFNKMKLYEKAIPFAKKAVAANDNSATSRANHMEHLAYMMKFSGDNWGAKAKMNELIGASPERISAYMIKASICMEMSHLQEAHFAIMKAIELGDVRNTTYRHASNLLNRMKIFDEAVIYATKAVSAHDNSDDSRKQHMEHLAKMVDKLKDQLPGLEAANDAVITQKAASGS